MKLKKVLSKNSVAADKPDLTKLSGNDKNISPLQKHLDLNAKSPFAGVAFLAKKLLRHSPWEYMGFFIGRFP